MPSRQIEFVDVFNADRTESSWVVLERQRQGKHTIKDSAVRQPTYVWVMLTTPSRFEVFKGFNTPHAEDEVEMVCVLRQTMSCEWQDKALTGFRLDLPRKDREQGLRFQSLKRWTVAISNGQNGLETYFCPAEAVDRFLAAYYMSPDPDAPPAFYVLVLKDEFLTVAVETPSPE
jgi:hypothetical protein